MTSMRPARQALGVVAYVLLFAALLCIPAGTLHWARAWVLLGVLLVCRAVGSWRVYQVQPELLAERARLPIQRGQPTRDRVLLATFMASFAGLISFDAVDATRLHLLGSVPAPLAVCGLPLFAWGWWLAADALRANAFAALVVRHQDERGQRVVDSGPYAVIRHPIYAAMIPVMTGMGLWLQSAAGVLLGAVPMAILLLRIRAEEEFLRAALPEYASYTARVRWRLVPGIW
jgi:protein-S-isoprenylcysteine O-methyltransferase Ste14